VITVENRFFPLRSAVCFLVEGGIILFSVIASFAVLNSLGNIHLVTFEEVVVRGFVIAFFCQTCMYMLDLYDLRLSQTWGEIFFSLMFAVGFVCIWIGVITYMVPGFGVEARMYYLTLVFVIAFLLFWRVAFYYYLERMAPQQNILIVGTGDVAGMVGKEIRERKMLGFNLAGFVESPSGNGNGVEGIGKVLGVYGQIGEIVRKYGISRIVVAIGERRGEYPFKEMLAMRVNGCRVVEWHGFFEKLSGRIPVDNLAPSFFIFNPGFRKSKLVLLVRRVLSTVIAAVGLLLILPLLLVVAVFIKIDSPGPVIYSQTRVGQRGRIFRIYKFRSMQDNAEENEIPRWAEKGDPRVTRVGRILRICRIDELPQLFNVIRGDLDLVGPRPERPEFVEKLEKMIPYYTLRHTVKPGLTGWAQIRFMYSGTFEESREKFQYDLFYIKNMSINLDLMILFQTIKIVLLGRGAR
jgi:sugar transferase (PEP-CTERM system associated)